MFPRFLSFAKFFAQAFRVTLSVMLNVKTSGRTSLKKTMTFCYSDGDPWRPERPAVIEPSVSVHAVAPLPARVIGISTNEYRAVVRSSY